jgi:glycosyltransferase involved in cell wall biosynthesis
METPRIAILIPAFNEEKTIADVVQGALEFGDVFVSNDGSTDKTAEVAERSGATILSQGDNQGYNSALNFGYQSLLNKGYLGIVTIDADGQHSPGDLHFFVESLLHGFDIVVGIRPKKARVMESVFGIITNYLWGVKDPLCGMKAHSVKVLLDKEPLGTYNSIGTEILVFALASGFKVKSIPISGGERDGIPRFAGRLRANFLICIALLSALRRIRLWREPRE